MLHEYVNDFERGFMGDTAVNNRMLFCKVISVINVHITVKKDPNLQLEIEMEIKN